MYPTPRYRAPCGADMVESGGGQRDRATDSVAIIDVNEQQLEQAEARRPERGRRADMKCVTESSAPGMWARTGAAPRPPCCRLPDCA